MTCRGCAAQVEKRLVAVAGVTAANVRHRSRRAYVVCRREVDDAALATAVSDVGAAFTARVVP
jgi:copper chaperone CopZ